MPTTPTPSSPSSREPRDRRAGDASDTAPLPGSTPGRRHRWWHRWWHRWPEWAAYVAAAWSAGYGALGLYWAAGGAGFPFGPENDTAAHLSLLAGARAATAAPVIAALGLTGAVVAVAMARGWGRGAPRATLLAFAWTAAAMLAIVIPDYRVLVLVAYTPIAILGAPFGWLAEAKLLEAVTWPIVNQALCMGGGLAWAAAAVAYQRRTRSACVHCGRGDVPAGWTAPASAARWGRWAVAVAVLIPVIYAATRLAWALGFPLGIPEELYRQGQATDTWQRGAALAALALGGAGLTLGLVRPWGEVFPRWIPLLGGRRVPPALAIVPAALVAVLVTAAGLMFVRQTLTGGFRLGDTTLTMGETWAALGPELLWPLWGVALAAAALAYHYRRRGRCGWCGRG